MHRNIANKNKMNKMRMTFVLTNHSRRRMHDASIKSESSEHASSSANLFSESVELLGSEDDRLSRKTLDPGMLMRFWYFCVGPQQWFSQCASLKLVQNDKMMQHKMR